MNKEKEISGINVSIFKKYNLDGNKQFEEIINDIKFGKFKNDILRIRSLKQDNNDVWNTVKDSLPKFTPCGIFKHRRLKENLIKYSGIIGLDFDHIIKDDETKIKYQELLKKDKYTYCSFVSPGGDGFKVFGLANTEVEQHEAAYLTIQDYFDNLLGVKSDKACKDITRLCNMSYDPEVYLNNSATIFKVDTTLKVQYTESKIGNHEKITFKDGTTQFEKLIELTLNKIPFIDGHRNKFINLAANNSNRWGLSLETTTNEILSSIYCYDERKVIATIKSAYKNVHQHNIFPLKQQLEIYSNFPTLQVCNSATSSINVVNTNPFIPGSVYTNLPNILKIGTEVFTDAREKDIFLTGSLGVLSGCFPSVSGIYHKRRVYSNLYTFITAPPASGKGALLFSKYYGLEYHRYLSRKVNETVGKSKNILFIPGNASGAAIMGHLTENDGIGVFFESEADSLSNSLKNDWGNFSDLLRKGYHHETVSQTRKGNCEYIEVEKPKLSVVLSGTPQQVQTLTKSVEDGLFSRFLFYSFKSEMKWDDVSPQNNDMDYTAFFENIGKLAYRIVETFLKLESLNFNLSNEQWAILNKEQEISLFETADKYGEDTVSLIKRTGLMWFRIAMILTILRTEKVDETSELFCIDTDFNTAKDLINIFKEHILRVYSTIGKAGNLPNNIPNSFLSALPKDEFQRKEAVEIGLGLNILSRDTDRLLKKFTDDGKLTKVKTGIYIKTTKSTKLQSCKSANYSEIQGSLFTFNLNI